MNIYLLRHGDASVIAPTDKERPLSQEGRQQVINLAQFFEKKNLTKPDLILVSPYTRAEQTFTGLKEALQWDVPVEILSELTPESSPESAEIVIKAYGEQYQAKQILVVAHMPLLGFLVHQFAPHVEPMMFCTCELVEVACTGERDVTRLNCLEC